MSEEEKKPEFTPELKEEIRARNIESMESICKAVNKTAPELIANIVTMNHANRVAELIKAKSEHITDKENGHRFDADVRFPDLGAGTVDIFKSRVSVTKYGCSVIIDNRQWITLEKDEFAKAVETYRNRMAPKLDNSYDKWLLPMLVGDREVVANTAGSVMLHGGKQKEGDLNAVFEYTESFSGIVNAVLPGGGGARDVSYTTRLAVSVETVIHGDLARLLVRMVANINAPYSGEVEGEG